MYGTLQQFHAAHCTLQTAHLTPWTTLQQKNTDLPQHCHAHHIANSNYSSNWGTFENAQWRKINIGATQNPCHARHIANSPVNYHHQLGQECKFEFYSLFSSRLLETASTLLGILTGFSHIVSTESEFCQFYRLVCCKFIIFWILLAQRSHAAICASSPDWSSLWKGNSVTQICCKNPRL